MSSSTSEPRSHRVPAWTVLVAVVILFSSSAMAQTQLQSFAISHGAGFTGDESVRIGVSLGQPMVGVTRNLESASGVGFWYVTQDHLAVVANESDGPPEGIPDHFELHANYPNPFNPTTRIRYGVPEQAYVSLSIYNVLGQLIVELYSGEKAPGYYDIDWNGRDRSGTQAPSGLYFYRIQTSQFVATRSMVLQK